MLLGLAVVCVVAVVVCVTVVVVRCVSVVLVGMLPANLCRCEKFRFSIGFVGLVLW